MPPEVFVDPLMDCLLFFTKLQGKNYTAAALRAGLPLSHNQLTPSLFVESARRIDFKARIVKRPLNKIHSLILPCVLILRNNRACVLVSINEEQIAEIATPESEMGITQVS